ncbi:22520_t:CDS:2 [Cetraspora pellucida]|uniref:22520_t:CDS:1 n=1 Tax=Cetraspora pellucida TaxID=1433469 RepID=A0A9N9GWT1_9GLOM|nr:22520_t:CDS:2 [Cetraspora pellucida]
MQPHYEVSPSPRRFWCSSSWHHYICVLLLEYGIIVLGVLLLEYVVVVLGVSLLEYVIDFGVVVFDVFITGVVRRYWSR